MTRAWTHGDRCRPTVALAASITVRAAGVRRRRAAGPGADARAGPARAGAGRRGVQGRRARQGRADVRVVPRSEEGRRRRTPPIARTAIAPLCAKCHADAAYMRKFAPQVRVDQYAQYQTSVHGKQMAKGETRVATCSDCHQAHGIVPVRDTRSPVAPAARREDLRGVPCRRGADEALQPVAGDLQRLVEERARRGAAEARRHVGADVQHLPRQPRRDAARRRLGRQRLRAVPRARGRAVQGQQEGRAVRRDGTGRLPDLPQQPSHRAAEVRRGSASTSKALCATCHDETIPGAAVIKSVRKGFDDLQARMTDARAPC